MLWNALNDRFYSMRFGFRHNNKICRIYHMPFRSHLLIKELCWHSAVAFHTECSSIFVCCSLHTTHLLSTACRCASCYACTTIYVIRMRYSVRCGQRFSRKLCCVSSACRSVPIQSRCLYSPAYVHVQHCERLWNAQSISHHIIIIQSVS